ncbi:hypothetical protein HRR83_008448 [Exophiala dermatitidis]|uniref:Uncharacterized protein n=1 Tax=Exophiala dermatitidis TaxID=5970 RepID=A0AAN6IR33_EXODE|nr:hypothetical protein HRR75_007698 [Exophiala dermatitidis]KAJ4505933.1 hypothetical protein HRR73_008263 [Exophiala dermatitidis]KAJ4506481.1 hypothetical protein HRR74_008379 [Exophiala dermatitidis]KAJ4533659.1 hypothetical protein HRR77_008419 [Exophiala dermatitidis]KAJ4539342.1 hypothetical protein HRR78_007822 [Exophiala dermatitidis]
MGWFWGGKSSQDDPTKSLDDDLKQFLKDQQPRPYVPAEVPRPPEQPDTKPTKPLPDTNQSFEDRPLPKESLFPDGRYRDIWKTYVPQNEIAAATTTPVERVLAARKDRSRSIHKAALENCAFEEELQQDCFKTGAWSKKIKGRMTMCHEETKAFNRCYALQAKFLQALGYMTSSTSSDEDEEKIQMHADKLYHRMMDYEAEVDDATRNGRPIPPLTSLFSPNRPAPTLEQISLPKPMEEKLKKPLHEYPPHERELVARAALQEAKLTDLYAEDLFNYTVTMNEDRKRRQAWLSKTFGEAVGKFLIPDPPKDPDIKPYSVQELERDIWREDTQSHTQDKNGTSSGQGPLF